MPLVLAAVTTAGLLAALFGDGAWDLVSWIALAIPAVLCLLLPFGRSPAPGTPPRP